MCTHSAAYEDSHHTGERENLNELCMTWILFDKSWLNQLISFKYKKNICAVRCLSIAYHSWAGVICYMQKQNAAGEENRNRLSKVT